MGVNSLPKTVTRQRRGCDLNPGPSAPESSTLTTRLPSHPHPLTRLCLTSTNRLLDSVIAVVSLSCEHRLGLIVILFLHIALDLANDKCTNQQTVILFSLVYVLCRSLTVQPMLARSRK